MLKYKGLRKPDFNNLLTKLPILKNKPLFDDWICEKLLQTFQNFLALESAETDKLAKVTTEIELKGIKMAATTGDNIP